MKITLKDGSFKEYEGSMSVLDITKDISEGLARVATSARVNGEVVDLRHVVDEDCELEILTFDNEEGKGAFWHTTSHIMAQAIKRLYPDTKLAIGPSIENGFYYDVDRETPFAAEDLEKIEKEIPYCRLNGDRERRLPNNVNFSFQYIEGESLLIMLDMKGICASSGSACTSGSLDPSHVLLAIGLPHEIAHGSLRLTLGDDTTKEDLDYVTTCLKEIVARLRSMSPLYEDFLKKQKKSLLSPGRCPDGRLFFIHMLPVGAPTQITLLPSVACLSSS